ncbi:MAG: glycosyltransferase family 2 protein [Pseudanabaena sp. ELA607]|jgi:glycosyltransferase involved in cell wall biosynthesis
MHSPKLNELPPPPEGKTGFPWTEESTYLPSATPDGSEWPKISIVTPNYNYGDFIEETIRSVLLQGYPNLEYIIIDGGSTDNSLDIIKKYEPWLTYWVSEKDKGQANAINKGFQRASGEILAYINSDDYYLPNAFTRVARAFSETQNDLIVGSTYVFPNKEKLVPHLRNSLLEWILTFNSSLPQPSVFWRNTKWLPMFDENLNLVFDRAFFMQFVIHKASMLIFEDDLAAFRYHDESKSYNLEKGFDRENFIVNFQMSEYLNNKEKSKALTFLRLTKLRQELHEITKRDFISVLKLLRILTQNPLFLFRREFYGRIKHIFVKSN